MRSMRFMAKAEKPAPAANRHSPKPCYVYLIVTCDDGAPKSYVGWTTDVAARLASHNAGRGAKATRGRQWILVHSETFLTRSDAMAREYALKNDRKARQRLLAR